MWAFFNRRGLVRQWKRKTDGLTESDIKSKFHRADINGDGRLNPKEFKKLLKAFGMEMSPADIDILIERFDLDGDGDIDLPEFRAFIESEQKNLFDTESGSAASRTQAALPVPKTVRYKGGSLDDSAASARSSPATRTSGGSGLVRPASAPRNRVQGASPRDFSPAPASALRRPGRDHLSKSVQIRAPYKENEDDRTSMGNKNLTYPSPAASRRRPEYPEEDLDQEGADFEHAVGGIASLTTGSTAQDPRRHRAAPAVPHRPMEEEGVDESVDALWVARMLQAQAEVEARLGRRYFN